MQPVFTKAGRSIPRSLTAGLGKGKSNHMNQANKVLLQLLLSTRSELLIIQTTVLM